jgi:hypothetical protein
MVGRSHAEQGTGSGIGAISEVEYARLALDPVEAVRNIFLALTKTGVVSREDFHSFLQDVGAVDGVNILEEDIDSAVTFVTKKQHNEPDSAGLNFQKFSLAMVFFRPVFNSTSANLGFQFHICSFGKKLTGAFFRPDYLRKDSG